MKTVIAIILALGVGFAAAYVIVSKQRDGAIAKLKVEPQAAVSAPTPASVEKIVMSAAPPGPTIESPQDILDDLINVKLGTGSSRNAGLRLIVFKLETLAQRGKLAVPAIRVFTGRNVDVDYGQPDNSVTNQAEGSRGFRGGNGGGRGESRRARNLETLQADWVVPPSLRLGLVGTLKEIGGVESELALAEMLNSTGRGVEVAYLAVVLEEMAPGKYRDVAINAAKELLMAPPAIDSPDRLDELSKSYLYGVLEYFKDTSFAVNAQQMLVGADGRLDQDAMDYLATVLKDQSVSALYSAYQNPALTNQFDKMRVGREVLNYVGQNSQANQLFTDALKNAELPPQAKAFVVLQLAGGGVGPFASEAPTDPQIISSRLNLLKQQEALFANDPTMLRALAMAANSLQSGSPIQPQDMRQIFENGGGRRGNSGNTPPPGGGN